MWYYAEDNQQRGPVTEADFQALLQAGTIKPDTLVWRDGMADWQPYREVKAAAGGGLICAGCGKPFPPEQVFRVGDRWVCATCSPIHLSQSPLGASGAGPASAAQVRERDYEHDIGGYLGRAWQLVQSDMGGIIGATTLVGLCIFALNVIPNMISLVSKAAGVASVGQLFSGLFTLLAALLAGPLFGGLIVFYLKKVRGQVAELSDAFSGFGPRFGQLLVARIVPGLLAMIAVIPAGILFVIAVATGALPINHDGGQFVFSGIVVAAIALGAVGILVVIYLQTCWLFTLWLVADKNMAFWPAMKLSRAVVCKHWWQTFLLGIVAGMVVLVGVLLCFVGLLVTAPIGVAMYAFAYEKLFGDLQSDG